MHAAKEYTGISSLTVQGPALYGKTGGIVKVYPIINCLIIVLT
jgi:hypothetical protein